MLRDRLTRLLDAIVFALTAALVSADSITLPLLVVGYLLLRWPRHDRAL